MFKKFFGLTLMLMFIASNCFAMTFSHPEKIGYAGGKPFVGQDVLKAQVIIAEILLLTKIIAVMKLILKV